MSTRHELKSLSDDELLSRLSSVLRDSRRVESVLVAHIGEVDARRLYAREASSSMFKFCTDVLHLSEAEAYLRIRAARAARRHPVLLAMLEDGRLHLSGIALLSPHLTEANRDELLTRASHQRKAAIQELVAEVAPEPDVAPSIRKVPERRRQTEPRPSKEDRPAEATSMGDSTTASGRSPAPPNDPPPEAPKRANVEPLSPARFKVQFTASAEFRGKLDRLAALMPGTDLASMLEAAVSEKLERIEAKRFGKTKRPRKSVDEAETAAGVRSVTAPVRRAVWERDGGQCTFVSAAGRRCPERDALELHHDEPYGVGGDRSAANIRLACRAHNLYMAERDYGKDVMDRFRRSADRVREPAPSLELRPDAVLMAAGNWGRATAAQKTCHPSVGRR